MTQHADQFKIKKEKPGYYNDGRGHIAIECAGKGDMKIYQDNFCLDNKEIEKVYAFLEKKLNPEATTTAFIGKGSDGLQMYPGSFSDKLILLDTLPDGSNADLSKALRQYDGVEITNEQALKMFEGETIEAIPSQAERLIIPAFGFAGGKETKREEWGANGPFMEDVKGLEFFNDKDKKNQVVKQHDGCLICYNEPGLKEKVGAYLEANPNTFKTANLLEKLVSFIKDEMTTAGKTPDLYDTDTNFVSGSIKDAPAKEDIKPGMVITGSKKKDIFQVVMVKEGQEFGGATAGKGGAYLRKDSKGDIKMIQILVTIISEATKK